MEGNYQIKEWPLYLSIIVRQLKIFIIMKNIRTYYHLILDHSGSMAGCIEQTIEGINKQIARIREVAGRFPDQELITSLTIFNDRVTRVWKRLLPGQLHDLTFFDYSPSGSTAMIDAIGTVITEMQRIAGAEFLENTASAVIVIITDGNDNSSTTYSHGQVSSMIRDLEQTGKWTFTYLGTTLDTINVAADLHIKEINAMRFRKEDSMLLFKGLNNSIYSYISEKQSGNLSKRFFSFEEEID